MYEFQGIDISYIKVLALQVMIRPYLAILLLTLCAIVGAVVIFYGFIGLKRLSKLSAGRDD